MTIETKGPADLLATIKQYHQIEELPRKCWQRAPVHLWEPVFCGDIDIRIAVDGSWYYQGSIIGRKPMIKLFSSVIRYGEDGDYYLVTPAEKLRIQVDDAPFTVVALQAEGKGEQQNLIFTLNIDECVFVDKQHPMHVEINKVNREPRPYVTVDGNLRALINRSVFYELVHLTCIETIHGQKYLGVWSNREFFIIDQYDDEF